MNVISASGNARRSPAITGSVITASPKACSRITTTFAGRDPRTSFRPRSPSDFMGRTSIGALTVCFILLSVVLILSEPAKIHRLHRHVLGQRRQRRARYVALQRG